MPGHSRQPISGRDLLVACPARYGWSGFTVNLLNGAWVSKFWGGSRPTRGGGVDGMAGVMRSYRAIAVLTAGVSGLVTIAFARLPQLHLGYAWPAVRLALETSGSLIALFATFLVFGRLRRRTYPNVLLLACALAVLALSNLLFVTVPTVADRKSVV